MTSLPSQTKTKPKQRISRKRMYALLASAFVVIISTLTIIELKASWAANLADNVLRPVIGNKATLAIETLTLELSDQMKQLAYKTVAKPTSNIYNPEPTTQVESAAVDPLAHDLALKQGQALDLGPLHALQPGFAKLSGEGEWSLVGLPQFKNQPLMARTIVRPDPARDYALVALVQMNMHELRLHTVAGTQHPGGELGHPGPGIIPTSSLEKDSLVAAFNGGFQYKDGHYGMTVGQTTYVPLQAGSGTLTIFQDGGLSIDRYNPLALQTRQIEAMRQNGPLILENGSVTSDVISGGYAVWGRTTTNSVYTWRSGVGLTKNGNLIYAVGPSLTAATLAQALKDGGAVQAIQLDINAYWVRFVTFSPTPPDTYSYQSILSTLSNGGSNYLHGYNKDFFYVTTQPPAK